MNPAPENTSLPGGRTQPAAWNQRQGRRLALLAGVALAATGIFRVYTTALEDPVLIGAGVAMLVLAALPALRWAQRNDRQLPAFEVLMLTAIPFYAFPLLDQKPAVALFSAEVMQRAATAVIAFQAAALLAHAITRGDAGRSPLWRESLLPDAYLSHARAGLALATAYQYLAQYTDIIPGEIGSVLRALFYGIGMLCAFILLQQWGHGQLTGGEKLFVAANLVAQLTMHFATLYLIAGASLLLLVLISYTSASRRVPGVLAVAAVAVIAFLHVGKSQMREIHWQPDAPRVTVAELPAFFAQWSRFSLAAHAASEVGITARLLERTSLFHVLCVAVESIPSRQPHLDGETYAIIPAQFVPRFFWSDKPGPHKSNARLAVYLGFVPDEEAAQRVSIAFGTPCEAYVNFGLVGMVFLGAAYGLIFKKISTLALASPPLSSGGVLMVLLLAWSLQAEMTLSVWISSLYQALVVLVGLPVALKIALGR